MPNSARVTDHLANERTFLAWVRTAIAVIIFGFAVGRFGLALRQIAAAQGTRIETTGASLWFGSVSIALGVLTMIGATLRYRRTQHLIEAGEYQASGTLIALMSGAIILLGCLLIVYLMITHHLLA
jgi:putative membrane protein